VAADLPRKRGIHLSVGDVDLLVDVRSEVWLPGSAPANISGMESLSRAALCAFALSLTPMSMAESPSSQVVGRSIACADYTAGKAFILSADGKIEWEQPAPHCNDLWVLGNGNVLFSTGHGVKEVTRAGATAFSYESKSEIYACQRLADGNTFVAECNAGRLLEIRPDGTFAKEFRLLPEGKDGGHTYIRNARKLASGNYLVTHYGEGVVREYDPAGKAVRDIPAEGGPHSAIRLPDGNTLIACGDRTKAARVFEVDPGGKVVWEIGPNDLPGAPLKFMAGLHRLPNGNTLMSNWVGHGQFGTAPHLIEVTRDKKVVWTFADHQRFRTISTVQLLGIPGDPIKGEILH